MIEKLYELKEYIISKKYIFFLIIFFLLFTTVLLSYFSFKKDDNIKNDLVMEKELIENNDIDKCSIDIKGYIANPGLYEIECDKRIMDVIKLAGGLISDSDTSVINLSKKVKDGMVLVIYSRDEVANFTDVKEKERIVDEKCKTSSVVVNDACITKNERVDNNISIPTSNDINTNTNSSSNVNSDVDNTPKIISLNNATKEELMTLKGVGEAKALAIINYREEHGLFNNIEELKNVKGIGEKMFEKIKDFITL